MKKWIFLPLMVLLFFIALPIVFFPYIANKPFGFLPQQTLSDEANQLIQKAFDDLEEPWVDYHVHLVGLGTQDTFVNPKMKSFWHPLQYYLYHIYLRVGGISDEHKANAQYLQQLIGWIKGFPKPGKVNLLALDKFYRQNGKVDLDQTTFYVSNNIVNEVAQRYPQIFNRTISVHPYRQDALEELQKWHQRGVRIIKWIPNAMGVDPSDPALEAYYDFVKTHDMVILTHSGIELAVDAASYQQFGNPLLWKNALDKGVKVIFAHVGSLGQCEDLDHADTPQVDCFDLAIRMMSHPKYTHHLFADISATVLINRKSDVLQTLLSRTDLHPRLINGSDYPIPAINVVISLQLLAHRGLLKQAEIAPLREIYDHNPLLFDFVLKRTIAHPETDQRFPAALFIENKNI